MVVLALDSFASGAGMVSRLFHDVDGGARAALLCWGIATAAFVILRAPRRILLACLITAAATVAFANMVVETMPAGAAVGNRPSAGTAPAAFASERTILTQRAGRGPLPVD